MNALNVGRIKLAAACLDAQRRAILQYLLNMPMNVFNLKHQFLVLVQFSKNC